MGTSKYHFGNPKKKVGGQTESAKNGGLKEGVGGMEESKMENEKETKAMGNNPKKGIKVVK